MNPGEKARLLQWVVSDLGDAFPGTEAFPGIERRADGCGGEPCIVRTRIPVWLLQQARRQGVSEGDLLRSYPTLRAEDFATAWGYVQSHGGEIAAQVVENEEASGISVG